MKIPQKFKGLTFNKSAMFTDIHFGKHSNSNVHNNDCLDFIDWFVKQVKSDKSIDHIVFLGDWNENRSSLDVSTLHYSYLGAKKLNEVGIPVFFIIGNHDLYKRHTREIHSVVPFNEFSNFIVIDEIVKFEEVGNGTLFCPFLFHDEYKDLQQYRETPVWFGHHEWVGYKYNKVGLTMETGPDPSDFTGPKKIFSGHFHLRQENEQIVYIGSAFPMDFSDADDNERGMAIYDHSLDELNFKNWDSCPTYSNVKISELINETNKFTLTEKSRVRCIVDIPLEFEETTTIKQKYKNEFSLREFVLEESSDLDESVSETEVNIDDLGTVDEMVVRMLNDIDTDKIENKLLIKIYEELII